MRSIPTPLSLILGRKEVNQFLKNTKIPFWVGAVSEGLKEVQLFAFIVHEQEFEKTFKQKVKYPCMLVIQNIKNTLTVVEKIQDLMVYNELLELLKGAIDRFALAIESQKLIE